MTNQADKNEASTYYRDGWTAGRAAFLEELNAARPVLEELNAARPQELDPTGRPTVQSMTDRELAEETVATLRALGDALQVVGQNPMLSAMVPGMGAMFGGR